MKRKFVLKPIALLLAVFCLNFSLSCNFLRLDDDNTTFITANAAGYDPSAAIAYAGKYWNNYNPAYPNCNPIGGDCANFVSQCLYAGGLQQNSDWKVGSAAWQACPSMYNYFNNCGYEIIINPTDEQLIAGNPVLYYSASKGRWSHAAICIGHNASGGARIAAHNSDHYDVDWKLGSNWLKRCTILINKSPIPPKPDYPPTYCNMEMNKTSVAYGEQIVFTASSDYATGYTIGIDFNGRRIVSQDLNGNTFTFTPTETGEYYAYISAWNGAGLVDSLGSTFKVYGSSPSNPVLSLDSGKNLFAADELIEFTATSDGATGYTIGIDRGASRIVTQDLNGNKYSFVPNVAGDYYSYVTAWNGVGITDSTGITFKVYDSAPKESYLSIVGGNNLFSVDSNISFVASSDCATGYTIGIDRNGERIITQDLNGSSFAFTPTEAGDYYTYVTSWNKYGICDSKGISFKVYDSAPSYSKIGVDRSTYYLDENVTFDFDSDSAIWYSVGIYCNGERYDSIWDATEKTYSYNVSKPGEYYAYVTSRNTKGWIDSDVVYFTVYSTIQGDANNDGEVTVADAVMLQKWLLTESDKLTCWQNVDLCEDGEIDVFDLCLLKRLLISSKE